MDMKTMQSTFNDESLNPCFEEGNLSKSCMKENFYDSDKCFYYFENYRNCVKFWGRVRRLRINKGIEPGMPDKEERQKILKERQKGNNVYKAT